MEPGTRVVVDSVKSPTFNATHGKIEAIDEDTGDAWVRIDGYNGIEWVEPFPGCVPFSTDELRPEVPN
jgi:hypothetical protein